MNARHGIAVASLSAWVAYAAWLMGHPISIASDDALYFVRGVQRFSVIELSPHFPGYPGFVVAARALDMVLGDPARSLFVLGSLAALSIPVAIYLWVRGSGVGLGFAWSAAACALLQPALPGLGVSMLSDSLGLALALWYLVALQRERLLGAGLLLGACIATRPSYVVLSIAALVALSCWRRDALPRVVLGASSVGVAAALFVLAGDGFAYFAEGARFVDGHFRIWARPTVVSADASWLAGIETLMGAPSVAAIGAIGIAWGWRGLHAHSLATRSAWAMGLSYAAWIFCAQNPDSIRHLFPLLFLSIGLAGIGLGRMSSQRFASGLAASLVASALFGFFSSADLDRRASPLERVSEMLVGRADAVLITHRGVEVLRGRHPELRIFDAYYEPSSRLAAREASTAGDVLRLSATPLGTPWVSIAVLRARFPGEHTLMLYEWNPDAVGGSTRGLTDGS